MPFERSESTQSNTPERQKNIRRLRVESCRFHNMGTVCSEHLEKAVVSKISASINL